MISSPASLTRVFRAVGLAAAFLGMTAGCAATQNRVSGESTPAPRPASRLTGDKDRVRHVMCLYDQRPWLNLDSAGDQDPEGLHFRVYLRLAEGDAILRDGTLHVEMYRVSSTSDEERERTLVSDWHYPTSAVDTLVSRILGKGYHLKLRWANKDIAGHDVEVITKFEDVDGKVARSGTKRLRVPKYSP